MQDALHSERLLKIPTWLRFVCITYIKGILINTPSCFECYPFWRRNHFYVQIKYHWINMGPRLLCLNTKARYKRHFPRENMAQLSINLRGVRIKSNMAANSNTRKINKHDINTVFFFSFAFVKFRNATAIGNIFALDKNNSRRVFYRGVERLVRRQIWPSWSHERRKQSRQQGIVAQIDLIKAWIRSLFRQI